MGKKSAPAPAPAPEPAPDTSGMDMFLADQANQNQMAMQNNAMNAQMMQAQPTQDTQRGMIGMKLPQQQEQNGMGEVYDPNTQLAATLQALRGG
jgi:hypothetical protein